MTDLDIYQPAQLGQYQAGLVMTPESAKALDEQVRACTKAVLQEGTDYGVIPGTNGEQSLWRPGAQKLLQWFGLGYSCERVEVERDDEGRKHGITYRAVVARRLPDGTLNVLATCEGTADYDESKFWQSAEDVQRKAEANERKWAKKDGRVADPTKWKNRGEYRADWNALMKRAQKRAIVGAVVDATAAGGIFTDREEDDHAPVSQHDGSGWYVQALEAAYDYFDHGTDVALGRTMYVEAADAHKRGDCDRKQQDRIQNIVRKRADQLKKATVVVDVEDLGRQAASGAELDPTRPAAPAATSTGTASSTAPAADGPSEDQPGSVSTAQLTKLHTVLTGLGFNGDDREAKLVIAEVITGRAPLHGPEEGRTSKNLSLNEARKLIDTLDGMDRDQLIAYMAEHEDHVRQETSDE